MSISVNLSLFLVLLFSIYKSNYCYLSLENLYKHFELCRNNENITEKFNCLDELVAITKNELKSGLENNIINENQARDYKSLLIKLLININEVNSKIETNLEKNNEIRKKKENGIGSHNIKNTPRQHKNNDKRTMKRKSLRKSNDNIILVKESEKSKELSDNSKDVIIKNFKKIHQNMKVLDKSIQNSLARFKHENTHEKKHTGKRIQQNKSTEELTSGIENDFQNKEDTCRTRKKHIFFGKIRKNKTVESNQKRKPNFKSGVAENILSKNNSNLKTKANSDTVVEKNHEYLDNNKEEFHDEIITKINETRSMFESQTEKSNFIKRALNKLKNKQKNSNINNQNILKTLLKYLEGTFVMKVDSTSTTKREEMNTENSTELKKLASHDDSEPDTCESDNYNDEFQFVNDSNDDSENNATVEEDFVDQEGNDIEGDYKSGLNVDELVNSGANNEKDDKSLNDTFPNADHRDFLAEGGKENGDYDGHSRVENDDIIRNITLYSNSVLKTKEQKKHKYNPQNYSFHAEHQAPLENNITSTTYNHISDRFEVKNYTEHEKSYLENYDEEVLHKVDAFTGFGISLLSLGTFILTLNVIRSSANYYLNYRTN